MNFSKELLEKAKQAKNAKELLELAKENGIELTEEAAEKYFAGLYKEGELADEELNNAAGGGLCDPEPPIFTKMLCDKCGCNTWWRGDYVNGVAYKCPLCSANAFYGKSTADQPNW